MTPQIKESIREAARIVKEQTLVCAANDDGLDCPDTLAWHMIDLVQCCAPKGYTRQTAKRVLKENWIDGTAYRVAKYFNCLKSL